MTKLTLSMEVQAVKKAKRIAARYGISVSKMFSDYVYRIDAENEKRELPADRALREIAGMIHKKTTAKKDMEDYRKYLESKYGVFRP